MKKIKTKKNTTDTVVRIIATEYTTDEVLGGINKEYIDQGYTLVEEEVSTNGTVKSLTYSKEIIN